MTFLILIIIPLTVQAGQIYIYTIPNENLILGVYYIYQTTSDIRNSPSVLHH